MKAPSPKTPLTYYGGKTRMANRIIKLIPQHRIYVEPFFGGGAVFFRKPIPETGSRDYREIINDQNDLLIIFYRTYRDNPRRLINRIERTLYSKKEFEEAKQILKNRSGGNVEIAWAVFVNISQSFMKCLGGNFRRSKTFANGPLAFRQQIAHLRHFEGRLKRATIECDDAIQVIKRWDSPETFFYLDPPYPGCDQAHYKGYSQADFEALIDTLCQIKGSFILSHYANSAIPKSWERHEFTNYFRQRKKAHSREFLFRKVNETSHLAAA